MPISTRSPDALLAGLVVACLVVFWASLPFPRRDHLLLSGDGPHYYAYLPSMLLDGDLDFSNDYRRLYAYDPQHIAWYATHPTDQGVPSNQWTIGPALLWAPFFLIAHGTAHLANAIGFEVATDGYGYLYQGIVLTGSILYGGAGLLLILAFVRRITNAGDAFVAVVLTAFAGNLVYYLTVEPSQAHAVSVFTSGLFFFTWAALRRRPGLGAAVVLGALGGLMALVRPQDGLFLLLPFLDRLPGAWREVRSRRWRGVGVLVRDSAVAVVAAFCVFSPQLMVWGALYGEALEVSYLQEEASPFGEASFRWGAALGPVLFSAWRGLFVWHPVFLLAVGGLLWGLRCYRGWGALAAMGFVMQWFLIGSWYGWHGGLGGGGFGARMFIGCTPLFALGLAVLLERTRSWRTPALTAGVGAFLIGWNALLYLEYLFSLAYRHHIPTWWDVTVGRIAIVLELLA